MSVSMMEELLHLLSPYNYMDHIAHLSVKNVFPQKLYALTELNEQTREGATGTGEKTLIKSSNSLQH